MTIRDLLANNENLKQSTLESLNMIALLKEENRYVDIVRNNQLLDITGVFIDREIKSWYICFDVHEPDVAELMVTL